MPATAWFDQSVYRGNQPVRNGRGMAVFVKIREIRVNPPAFFPVLRFPLSTSFKQKWVAYFGRVTHSFGQFPCECPKTIAVKLLP